MIAYGGFPLCYRMRPGFEVVLHHRCAEILVAYMAPAHEVQATSRRETHI